MSALTGYYMPTAYDDSHPELPWHERHNMQLVDELVDRKGNAGVRGYCVTSPTTARMIDREIAEEERRMWAPKSKHKKGRL
jgi:hypothetical protein